MRTRSSRGSLNLQSYLLLCLTTITFIGTSFRRNRATENSVSEGGTALVAIVLCTKSVGSWKGVQDSSLVSILLPSVTRTVTRAELQRLRLEIFAAYDVDDVFWNTYANRRTACESFRLPINFMAIRKESKRIPFNEVAAFAFEYGAEYLVRVNDDTEFLSTGWISQGIAALNDLNPPNVGVVGPTCEPSPKGILTHDMVHSTHLHVFETYYPPSFDNWWIDDWISAVYGERMKQLTGWKVQHHIHEHGTRYEHNDSQKLTLPQLIDEGKERIKRYMMGSNSLVTRCRLNRKNIVVTDGPAIDFWVKFEEECTQ